jgi:hypothetical protein
VRALTFLLPLSLMAAASGVAHAQSDSFNASRTFEFDPDRTGCAVANWDTRIGLPDSTGHTNFGLRLEKNCATSVNASAGAVLNAVKGTLVQMGPSMGYDIQNTSPCGAGAPRFNVQQSDGSFHFVGGCANGTKTPIATGWTRVTFDPYSPAQAFPPLTVGATVVSITLIVDEEGKYVLDNIQLNGLYAQKPGAAK